MGEEPEYCKLIHGAAGDHNSTVIQLLIILHAIACICNRFVYGPWIPKCNFKPWNAGKLFVPYIFHVCSREIQLTYFAFDMRYRLVKSKCTIGEMKVGNVSYVVFRDALKVNNWITNSMV